MSTTPTPTGTEAKVCALIAQRQYGRWTLLNELSGGRHPKWRALCECGKEKVVDLGNVKRGKSTSCGCFRGEVSAARSTTHGQSGKTSTYKSWSHMKGRCLNETDTAFKDYGGRGIRVYERWLSFENFYADMGECPRGYSIERIDVNGHYEPGNCAWIPRNMQPRNTRKTRFTTDLITQIRHRLSNGESTTKLASEFGCGSGHIRQIRSFEIWRDV